MQPKNKPQREHRHRYGWTQIVRTALSGSLVTFILVCCARGEEASEYQVKAAYLYNFAKSAQWPAQILPDDTAPLVIGVFGGDQAFVDILKDMVAVKTVGTHPIAVKHLRMGDDLACCHMVFFRASERKNTPAAIASSENANVLLVGEDSAFLRAGGMINLVLDKGKVQFEIAHDAIERSNIHFSSKFLSLAKANHESYNQQADGPRQLRVKISPEYPTIARRMNLKGAVQLEALVGRDGTVKEVKVLGGHPLLADALARAVKQWKYEPAARDSTEVVKYSFGPEY